MYDKTCMDCKYFNTASGVGACIHACGFSKVILLLLLGPKPLFSMNPCDSFVAKGDSKQSKFCKLFKENVMPSEYNNMGKCECIEKCVGPDCGTCITSGIINCYAKVHNCAACREYSAKVMGN